MELFTNGNRATEAQIYTDNMNLAAEARQRAMMVAGPLAVESLVQGSFVVSEEAPRDI